LEIPETILELKGFVRILFDKVQILETENASLKIENVALKEEIAQLKASLNLDSHNSSKPPSSDGLKKKPAFPREKNGKQGGQKDHHGKTLEMVKNPDYIVKCQVQKCTCGQDLSLQPSTILARRQEFDIPEPHLEVTEFQLIQTKCPVCGQVHKGVFPEEIKAPTQYGYRTKAFTTLLTNDCKLSYEAAQTLFCDIYGYSINEGTIYSANQTGYNNLETTEQVIQDQIVASPTVNEDETGFRCQGKLHWLHVACTSLFTYMFVHAKRGKEAIESDQSILKRIFGWCMHDCWSSYFNLTHLKHALCGAHILRELQAQIDNGSQWANSFKTFLLKVYHTQTQERINNQKEIEAEYDLIINQGQIEEPQAIKIAGKKGKKRRTKGRNLLERLQKYKLMVLAFAFNPDVPFTNNQAERDIRPMKVKMKISGSFRTFTGAKHYARIAGFISTARKHKLNVFKELCNVFKGQSFLIVKTC